MLTERLSQAFISTSNLLRVARNVFSPAGSYPKKASGVIYSPSEWSGGAINGFLFVSHEVDSAYNRILFGDPIDGKAFNGFLFVSCGADFAYNRILFDGLIAGKAFNRFLFVSRGADSAYNRILFGGPIAGKAFNGFLFVSRGVDSAYNRILFGGHAPQGAPLLLSMDGPFLSVAPIYIMYRSSGEKVVRFFRWVCLSVTNKGLHLRCIKQKRDDSNNQIPSDDERHSPQSCEKYHAFTATTAPWLPIDFQFAMP